MYLADAIEGQARAQPGAVALIHGQNVVRYGELAARIRRCAAMLGERGLRAGDVVGITMGNTPLHLLLLLALTRMGAVSVGIHPMLSDPRKRMVVDEYGVSAVLSDQAGAEIGGLPCIVADTSWMDAGENRGSWRGGAVRSGDLPWRIGLSSGTTGKPKGVLRSQAQTLNLVLLQRTVADIGPGARYLLRMDLNLTANVLRVLGHLVSGGAIVFPRSLHNLGDILDAITRHGATHTVVSPEIVGGWVKRLPPGQVRAPGLQNLTIVGGRLSASLRDAIVDRLTPNVFVSYGTTESGTLAVGDLETHRRYPDGVGRVVPWARARIVDEQGKTLPAGQSGIVRFQSVGAADAYYRNPEASARSFRDGWVYPGDVGRITPDGVLLIESRVDDVINVNGIKVEPAGLEEALCEHPAVADAAVFSWKFADGKDRLCAAVVPRDGAATDEQGLIRHCQERVGRPLPQRVIVVRELPRNLMGKLVRHELAARFRPEDFETGAGSAKA